MSGVGFVMLVHQSLNRAAQLARHWAQSGCPVIVHVDRRVGDEAHRALAERLRGLENVRLAPRHRCEWGTWSIVEATLAASQMMLDEFPRVGHVMLASGSCLPLRPVPELVRYLARRPDTDFIESVTTPDDDWAKGGLGVERFTLRFPFAWQRHRRLFDGYVRLQRRVGFRRRLPEGLVPHLGSQWWCLTRRTLTAILTDPERPRFDRYFRRVWIPDESYFQSLARRHARRIESRSLTLSRFDSRGKPFVFHDDHLDLLRGSDCFVARKIWPQADVLYRSFLSNDPGVTRNAEPNPGRIDRLFSRANDLRLHGRPGLRMQSRFPRAGVESGKTAAPYLVFEGFDELFDDFGAWLQRRIGGRVHGHLFAPDRVAFASGATGCRGALSDSASLRDYDPEGFLLNLVWNTRGERQAFQFGPADRQEIGTFIAGDANARIAIITGAWAIPLFRSQLPLATLRIEAARLQAIEARHLQTLRAGWARSRPRLWTLAEFLESPMAQLQSLVEELAPPGPRRPAEAPRLRDLAGFAGFLQKLRNEGMNPHMLGDFPPDTGAALPEPGTARAQAAE